MLDAEAEKQGHVSSNQDLVHIHFVQDVHETALEIGHRPGSEIKDGIPALYTIVLPHAPRENPPALAMADALCAKTSRYALPLLPQLPTAAEPQILQPFVPWGGVTSEKS